MTDAFILLACTACAYGNPMFQALALFVGTVPVGYALLRPYTGTIPVWGLPQIDWVRLGSLLFMLACLVPLWFIGRQDHSVARVVVCLSGLAVCCVYLWYRACWLLDAHGVTSPRKEVVFLGLFLPALFVFGMTVGIWGLGIVLFVPVWPEIFVPHTVWALTIGCPSGLLAILELNYAIPKPALSPSRKPRPEKIAGTDSKWSLPRT